MTGPAKLATVHFYFDADVLGLAKTVVKLRSDVTYPGDPGGRGAQTRATTMPHHQHAAVDAVLIPEG